jgi:parallel beta-helix repeat protein
VALAWTASSGATSYTVKRALISGGPHAAIQTGLTATSFTDTGLTNGTTYYYVVTASGPAGESPASNEVAGTPAPPLGAVSAECQRWQGSARVLVSPATSADLTAALAAATPGTMIELQAGVTYTASGSPQRFRIEGKSGTATDRIFLCGPASAVLMSSLEAQPADDGGMSTNYGLWLNDSSYWVVDGFTVRTANKGVILDGSSNNTIRYLNVSDLGEEGIHLRRGSSNNVVEYNTVENTGNRVPGFGEAIYVGTAAGNWLKVMGTLVPDRSDGNIIRFNTTRSRSEGVDVKEGTTGGRIENNTIYGTYLAGSTEVSADSCMELKGKSWIISRNHCETTLADGLQVKNQSGACTSAGTTCPDSGSLNVLELNSTNMATPTGGTATGYSINVSSTAQNNTVRCNNTLTGKAASYLTNVTCVP